MRYICFGLGLCAAAGLLNGVASAAEKTAAAGTAKEAATETVTVSGFRPKVEVFPDRTVYNISSDSIEASGSLADVMKYLPLVDIDMDGNITLRGQNVTILVDGHPSVMFSKDPGEVLKQLPAGMVEKIEVMTNPPAEYKAEGTGGIINIVLKKNRKAPAAGIARVNVGTEGQVNASLMGHAGFGPLALTGTYSEGRTTNKRTQSVLRSSAATELSTQDITTHQDRASRMAMLKADYHVDNSNTVGLSGIYMLQSQRMSSLERAISDTAGTDITRDGLIHMDSEAVQSALSYRHDFAKKGETFDLHLSHQESWSTGDQNYDNIDTASGESAYLQSRNMAMRQDKTEFTADYVLPLPGRGAFDAGYDLESLSSPQNMQGFISDDGTAWSVDADYTNNFIYARTTHAGYATYNQNFGAFGVKGGLRLQQDCVTTNLKTTGEVDHTSRLGFFPSLYLTYQLTDTHQVGLSYSRRTERPGVGLLNPAQISTDAYNARAGNPTLKPEMVNAFEATYHFMGTRDDIELSGYYRTTSHAFSKVYETLSDSVLLRTYSNLAHEKAAGMSANMRFDILENLSLRAAGYFAYTEFDPESGSAQIKTTGTNWTTTGGIDWHITPEDEALLQLRYRGKQIATESRAQPYFSGAFGYKHSFSKSFSAVVQVSNLFASEHYHGELETDSILQESRYQPIGRRYFVGLVYSFGGGKDPKLDVEPGSGDEPE